MVDSGAVTWGDGTTGVDGPVSESNSLVGSAANDKVGSGGVILLNNGNYVVSSPDWANLTATAAGAVTWADGTTGVKGKISKDNSLVGSHVFDQVGHNGYGGVTALSNGNYVVCSPYWDNSLVDVGAVTWCTGTTGRAGRSRRANSLVGSMVNDRVGSYTVTALNNGHYVVSSPKWNGAAGAVTWCDGTTMLSDVVSPANSLVGSVAGDLVGEGGAIALNNGNYVVISPDWANSKGAVTWGNGLIGVKGVVSDSNSLVGSTDNDYIGNSGVTALSNGNYVVNSPLWDGAVVDVGAVTWGDGTIGVERHRFSFQLPGWQHGG